MLMSSEPKAEFGPDGAGGIDMRALIRSTLAIARRRWVQLVSVAVAIFAVVVALLLLMTPKYDAYVRIQLNPKPMAANGVGNDPAATVTDQSVIDTEMGVMHSRDIAIAVVKELHLDRNPLFTKGLNPDQPGGITQEDRIEAATGTVLGNVIVNREKMTYLIDLGYRSTDPETAARVANAFARAYIRSSVTRRSQNAEQQFAWLDKRLDNLSQQARGADAALAQYQAAHGITQSATAGTITDQQIAPLSMQLATAQAADAAARSDVSVARAQMRTGGAAAASSVLNSPAIQDLRSNRAATMQRLSQLSVRYGPKHPQTVQAEQQLAAIDAQISDEAKRIVGELESKAHATSAQAGSLAGDLSRLRGQQAGDARLAVTSDSLKRDADAKHNAYNRLADLVQQVDQAAQSSMAQAQIIEAAQVPTKAAYPPKMLILVGGFLVAVTASVGLALVRELMTAGFTSNTDIERTLGLKFIASVPLLKGKQLGGAANPAESLADRPLSAYAESFRVIRSSLLLGGDRPPQVTAVVSTLPGEGKTTSALSLARILALSGERTLLIDCDLRREGVRDLVREEASKAVEVGLVEVLRDGVDADRAIFADRVAGLDIMTSMGAAFTPEDLFGGPTMRTLLETMRSRYDRIVLDTPPLLGVADARHVAVMADTTVVVVKWNETARSAVKLAVNWLRVDNAQVAGAVLSMVDASTEAAGALYYSRLYGKYYQAA